MTALEAVAQREATVAYHSARRLARFAPSETLVIARIDGNEPRGGMWG